MGSISGIETVFIRKAAEDVKLEKVRIKTLIDQMYGPKEYGLKDVSRLETVSFNFETRMPEITKIISVGRYPWGGKMVRADLASPYKTVTLTLNHIVFKVTLDGIFATQCGHLLRGQSVLVINGGSYDKGASGKVGATEVKQMMFTKKTDCVYDIVTSHENVILGNSVIVGSS